MARFQNFDGRKIVLDLLMKAAERGDPCPKNSDLSAAAGCSSPSASVNFMKRLEREGVISVKRGNVARVVTIVATGKSTAGEISAVHWRLASPDKAKAAAAKTRDTNSTISTHGYRSVNSQPTGPIPEPIDRDPCFMCGTRHDIGCEHHRRAA